MLPWGRPSFFVVCRLRSSLTPEGETAEQLELAANKRDRGDSLFATAVSRMKAVAAKPDGTTVPLLWIRDWDFAW